MRRKIFFIIPTLGCLLSFQLIGQTTIDVAENTVKLGVMTEDFFYYGFAEGDKMIFNFEMVTGKEIKELEITEYPSGFRFLELKPGKISNKIITIPRTGIYKFRFNNTAILPRAFKYKIQRIPASPATQKFNTNVYNEMVTDTAYTFELEDYLEKVDTIFTSFQDRLLRVNATSNATGNKIAFNFLLPPSTIAWSYYICAGKEGLQAYDEANKKLLANLGQIISKYPYYNILCAVALGRTASISKLQTGTSINYWVMDADNAALFSSGSPFKFIKNGKAVNDYSQMTAAKGNLHFGFSNENPTEAVNVSIKITSVHVNEIWATKQNKKMIINSKRKMYLKN